MRRAIALTFLYTTLLALGAGAVWATTLIACPNVLGSEQCMGTSRGDVMTATSSIAARPSATGSSSTREETRSSGARKEPWLAPGKLAGHRGTLSGAPSRVYPPS